MKCDTPDLQILKDAIRRQNCDAYVIYDSAENCDMRYLSRFPASDPYLYLCTKEGHESLIVASMEELRAEKESRCPVISRTAAGFTEYLADGCSADEAAAKMIKNRCGGGDRTRLLVPYSMPAGFARALSAHAEVVIDAGTVNSMRAVKSPEEIEEIRAVQHENEKGVHLAVDAVRKSEISENDALYFEDAPLTSEKIRKILHEAFYDAGLEDRDTIISCGPNTALPHAKGEGQLFARQPIVMDVFPRGASGYFADMTRTVSKGKPDDAVCAMYKTVHDAKELAASMIRPGISGAEVHNAVSTYFKEQGFETAGTSGFIHSLGHGVGLAIHESPSLSPRGETLLEGHVVTIEPGLYYPGCGGVRLEDMGAVTENGFDRFTIFEEELIIA
ncbi:MAG TPA: Xaa-Pro peptidase family protein [Methanocorpusculum sp.]|nr:aminopeptidase P family protein [Candidatus Methanocorpusculum equi]HJJ33157.1 Xaa-Pro peptidase family protein [Methanocorpusculum sp.]